MTVTTVIFPHKNRVHDRKQVALAHKAITQATCKGEQTQQTEEMSGAKSLHVTLVSIYNTIKNIVYLKTVKLIFTNS